jgi:hypothetical protein
MDSDKKNGYKALAGFLVIVIFYYLLSSDSDSTSKNNYSSETSSYSTETSTSRKDSYSVKEESKFDSKAKCYEEIETFFQESNNMLYKISEHGSTLVLNVKLNSSIGRPEGIAETLYQPDKYWTEFRDGLSL